MSIAQLTFDCASRHAGDDLALEEEEHDQRDDRDDDHVRKEQVPLVDELAGDNTRFAHCQ